MKRYKILVQTIQGQLCFFCHWKMGNTYSTRLVNHRNDAIWYYENEINIAENYLKNNLEKVQVKSYCINEIENQLNTIKAQRKPYTRVIR